MNAVIMRYYRAFCREIIRLYKYVIGVYCKDNILLNTPKHGNIGDHAIAVSEYQFFTECGKSFLELAGPEIKYREKVLAFFTPRKKVIFVHGGGYLGSLWPNEEYRFQRILKAFSKNKIIVFPQTVTFNLESEDGKLFFQESKRIYEGHKNLTVFVREEKSYHFMQEYMPKVKVELVPDIVTQLRIEQPREKRMGILLCMRSDVEKTINAQTLSVVQKKLQEMHPQEPVQFTDTVVDHSVFGKERSVEVQKKLNEFSQSKLVITDRLHGMVFAALTGTPCIAFTNSNGKVKGVYQWIKHNQYVKYVDSVEEFENALSCLDIEKEYSYDYGPITGKFEKLREEISKL